VTEIRRDLHNVDLRQLSPLHQISLLCSNHEAAIEGDKIFTFLRQDVTNRVHSGGTGV
jgi:hypothetical protein